jgi:hypothetical protein
MVKANSTVSFSGAAVRAEEFVSLGPKSARMPLRKENGRPQSVGDRKTAPETRDGRIDVTGGSAAAVGAANVGEYIGRELRSLYDDVVAQPVPDRFLMLLNKLESESLSAGEESGRPGD